MGTVLFLQKNSTKQGLRKLVFREILLKYMTWKKQFVIALDIEIK